MGTGNTTTPGARDVEPRRERVRTAATTESPTQDPGSRHDDDDRETAMMAQPPPRVSHRIFLYICWWDGRIYVVEVLL
jgi:hypothetical protein